MQIIPLGSSANSIFNQLNSSYSGTKSQRKGGKMYYGSGSYGIGQEEDEDDESDETWQEKTITKIKIKTKTKKKNHHQKTGYYETDDDDTNQDYSQMQLGGVYSMYLTKDVDVAFKTPKSSVCMTWNGNKIKTFDGLIYASPLYCAHTLIQDMIDGTFSVVLRSCPFDAVQPCPHSLVIFLQNLKYTFEEKDGKIKLFTPKKELPIPAQLSGLRVTMVGHKIKIGLEAVGATIYWDMQVSYIYTFLIAVYWRFY